MLDHLDDPAPPALDGSLYGRVVRTARRRRLRNRAAATGAGLTLCAGGAAVLVRSQADQLERIRVDGLSPATSPTGSRPSATEQTQPAVRPDSTLPPPGPLAAPMNVLLVGVDTAPEVGGTRGDTIAIVRLDPVAGQVRVLSVPRDLYVGLPNGSKGRINTVGSDPGQLISAIHDALGVDLQHFLQIDFPGFVELVDIAGGVAVPFDRPVRDTHTGFLVAEPGCFVLDGDRALAYARSRRLEVFDSAAQSWVTDGTSDFGRVARQQDLMTRLYRQVLTASYGPVDELRLLTDIADDITVDEGLTLNSIRQLFATARAIGPDDFHTYDLAGTVHNATINGAAVLVPDAAAVADLIDRFLTGEPAAASEGIPPAEAVVPPADETCP